jgi:hypothetical protein
VSFSSTVVVLPGGIENVTVPMVSMFALSPIPSPLCPFFVVLFTISVSLPAHVRAPQQASLTAALPPAVVAIRVPRSDTLPVPEIGDGATVDDPDEEAPVEVVVPRGWLPPPDSPPPPVPVGAWAVPTTT